jgi:LCP family protein required for cell wall assembly
MSELPPSPPPPPRPSGPPEYKVYRSRKRLSDRFGPIAGNPLEALRRRRDRRPSEPGVPGTRAPRPTWRRVLKWALVAIGTWILISIVAFFISAQTAPGVSDQAKQALSGGGSVLTGTNVLVLGSDQRVKGTKEPGASTSGPSRSDSIMVLHMGVGSVRKLSILRDTRVDIPGHGSARINAAYAYGGAALTIKTVENFLPGVKINHIVEVSFTNFPKLIDALGGVDITLKKCVISNSFGGKRVRLRKGDQHLNGDLALRFARVRKNACSPNEDDRARAARQQQVLAAMRDKVASPTNWPSTFIRGPFVAWEAPRAFKSDMHGPGLSAMFIDLLSGGSGATDVLKPDVAQPFNSDGTVNVTQAERTDAVKTLLGK